MSAALRLPAHAAVPWQRIDAPLRSCGPEGATCWKVPAAARAARADGPTWRPDPDARASVLASLADMRAAIEGWYARRGLPLPGETPLDVEAAAGGRTCTPLAWDEPEDTQ